MRPHFIFLVWLGILLPAMHAPVSGSDINKPLSIKVGSMNAMPFQATETTRMVDPNHIDLTDVRPNAPTKQVVIWALIASIILSIWAAFRVGNTSADMPGKRKLTVWLLVIATALQVVCVLANFNLISLS